MSALGGGVPRFDAQAVSLRNIPSFAPTAPNEAARLLDNAGNFFDGIARTANHLRAQRVEYQAEEAGMAAGFEQGFDPSGLPQDMTIASQAYRQGAFRSYTAALEMSREEAFNRLEMEYLQTPEGERQPDVLRGKLQAWVEGTAANLPDNLKPGFMQVAMNKANPLYMAATEQHLGYQQRQADRDSAATLELVAQNIGKIGLPRNEAEQTALDTWLLQGVKTIQGMRLTPKEQEVKLSELNLFARKSAIIGEFNGASDKLGVFERFTAMTPQELKLPSLEEKNRLAAQMQSVLSDEDYIARKHTVAMTREQNLNLELTKNRFQQRIDDGDETLTEQELVTFWQENPSVGESWLADRLFALNGKREGQWQEQQEMDDLAQGRVPFDPSDASTRKRLDRLYMEKLSPSGGASLPIPGAVVTSGFGARVAPNAKASTNHHGVDYGAKAGSPIRPTVGGTVIFSGTMGNYGNVVDVQQADGYTVRYAHNAKNLVTKGDKIAPGQSIAQVGATGNATGPHTHVEVRDRSGRLVDPQNYFAKQTPQKPTDEEAVKQYTTWFVKKFRYVPELYRNETVGLLHGTPEQVAMASERIAFMQDNGVDLDGFDRKDAALALRVASDVRRGIAPVRAVEMARFALDPQNQNLVEGNKKRVEEALKKPENQPDHLFDSGGFLGIGVTVPEIPVVGGVWDNYHSDWDAIYSDAYLATGGHEESARKVATAQMKKLWGVSAVDGSARLMKYPPESFYKIHGDGHDADWIRKQLYKDVGKAVKPGSVFLDSDQLTAREASRGVPSYGILVKNARGELEPLVVGGKIQRFTPDARLEIQRVKAQQEKAAQKAVTDASKTRPNLSDLSDKGALAVRKGSVKVPQGTVLNNAGGIVAKQPARLPRDLGDGGKFAREQAERRELETLRKKAGTRTKASTLTETEMQRFMELQRKY